MATKRQEIYKYMQRQAERALDNLISCNVSTSPEDARVIRRYSSGIALRIADEVSEHYRFLELADIMGWKKTRTRR